MSFLHNRVLRRFSIIGRLADIALVGGLVLRVAQRKGLLGLSDVGEDEPVGLAEIVLATAAVLRLLRRNKRG